MNAVPERELSVGVVAFDVEHVRFLEDIFVLIGGDVPHEQLVVLLDLLAAKFGVASGGTAHVRKRGLPTDHFRYELRDEAWIGKELVVLVGEFIEPVDAAGHRIAGGVVAADDQQQQVAELVERGHVLGGFAVGEHRDEIKSRVLAALFEQFFEILNAFHEFIELLLLGLNHAARLGNREDDIGPASKLAAIVHREVEQGRQHQSGEFDRDDVDPVECLPLGQGVEQGSGAFADHRLNVAQIARCRHASHRLALIGVGRRVHRDEGLYPWLFHFLGSGDLFQAQTDALRRRVCLPVTVDGPDIVVLGNRPVPPGRLEFVEVHRILGPKAGEVLLPTVFPEQVGVWRIDLSDVKVGRCRNVNSEFGHFHFRCADGSIKKVWDGRVGGVGHGITPLLQWAQRDSNP